MANSEARKALEDARRHSQNVKLIKLTTRTSDTYQRRCDFAKQILEAGSFGRDEQKIDGN